MSTASALMTDLSPEELDELDAWLASPGLVDSSMDVAALEGFVTALAIGPRTVPPSAWLPWVWDMFDGRISPDFDSVEDANHVLTLVMRLHNGVIRRFMDDPDGFEPVFLAGEDRAVFDWCDGFMFGTQFNTEEWDALLAEQPDWFTPFIRLGTEEGLDITEKENDAERWTAEVVPALLHIHDHWRKQRQDQPSGLVDEEFMLGGDRQPIVRETAKVGRNDPCPCGSGRKYKKCCGADAPATG